MQWSLGTTYILIWSDATATLGITYHTSEFWHLVFSKRSLPYSHEDVADLA